MDDVTARVARQYNDYVYPPPVDDLAAAIAAGQIDFCDPSRFGPLFWPEGRPDPAFSILVAGCGAQQAAWLAFTNPSARVTGVDLSDASLGHQRYLREKHGLSNLHLYQGDLREVAKLGQSFDLIVSSGVLHHMADPDEGLAALVDVLAPTGAMALMVYGARGRTGVYMMQDAFRRLGLGQSAQDVEAARRVLAALPADHLVRPYLRKALELQHDTALVDTFLHPQDRAYTVPEVLDWIEGRGLAFQAWSQNQLYYPEVLIDAGVRPLIRRLPDREQWAVVETMLCAGNHILVARHAGREQPVDLTGEDWLRYRPNFKPGAGVEAVRDGGSGVVRLWSVRLDLAAGEMAFARLMDGEATIGAILADAAFTGFARAELEALARAVFDRLWKMGVAMFQI